MAYNYFDDYPKKKEEPQPVQPKPVAQNAIVNRGVGSAQLNKIGDFAGNVADAVNNFKFPSNKQEMRAGLSKPYPLYNPNGPEAKAGQALVNKFIHRPAPTTPFDANLSGGDFAPSNSPKTISSPAIIGQEAMDRRRRASQAHANVMARKNGEVVPTPPNIGQDVTGNTLGDFANASPSWQAIRDFARNEADNSPMFRGYKAFQGAVDGTAYGAGVAARKGLAELGRGAVEGITASPPVKYAQEVGRGISEYGAPFAKGLFGATRGDATAATELPSPESRPSQRQGLPTQQPPTAVVEQPKAAEPPAAGSTIAPGWQQRYPNGQLGQDGSVIVPTKNGWTMVERNFADTAETAGQPAADEFPKPLPEGQPQQVGKFSQPQQQSPMAGIEMIRGDQVSRFNPQGKIEQDIQMPLAPRPTTMSGFWESPEAQRAATDMYGKQVDAYRTANGLVPLDQAQARFQNVQADELPGENRSKAGERAAHGRYLDANAGLAGRTIAAKEDYNRILEDKNTIDAINKIDDETERTNAIIASYNPNGPPSQLQNLGKAAVRQQGQAIGDFYKENSGWTDGDPTPDIIAQFFPRTLPQSSARAILDNVPDEKLRKVLGAALYRQYSQ